MDPATLALAVAPLVAKAAEHFGGALWNEVTGDLADRAGKATGEAGWSVLGQMAGRVRQWFQGANNDEGVKALDVVAAAPDSQMSVEKLAGLLKVGLGNDPAFAEELEQLVEKAKAEPGEVGRFSVQVFGNAQVGKIQQFQTVITKKFQA